MQQKRFSDLVDHKRLGSCSSCDTNEYQLPLPLTKEIGTYLEPFGQLMYPLDKVGLIKIDNERVNIQARLGRTSIRVKFKQKGQRPSFEEQLAKYLGTLMQLEVIPD